MSQISQDGQHPCKVLNTLQLHSSLRNMCRKHAAACRSILSDTVPVLLLGLTDDNEAMAGLCKLVLLMLRAPYLLLEVRVHI